MSDILDTEAGVCSGLTNQHHPLCIVNEPYHDAHIVDVIIHTSEKE